MEWFAQNPARSHRLRPVWQGEEKDLPCDPSTPRKSLAVVVRQVEPGRSLRVPVGIDAPLVPLEDEAKLSALFDAIIANADRRGVHLNTQMEAGAARQVGTA